MPIGLSAIASLLSGDRCYAKLALAAAKAGSSDLIARTDRFCWLRRNRTVTLVGIGPTVLRCTLGIDLSSRLLARPDCSVNLVPKFFRFENILRDIFRLMSRDSDSRVAKMFSRLCRLRHD